MKTDCNVIKDLIPLYIDKVSSEESNKLIEEHFSECTVCKEYFETMKEEPKISSNDEKNAIKSFLKKIKKRRFLSIVIAVIITITIILTLWNLLNKVEFSVKYRGNLITTEEPDEETFIININSHNYNHCQLLLVQTAENKIDVYVSLTQTIMDNIDPKIYKGLGCLPLCYHNFIDDNYSINWDCTTTGKITFNIKNNAKIGNVYYLENKNDIKTLSHMNLERIDSMPNLSSEDINRVITLINSYINTVSTEHSMKIRNITFNR